MNTSLFQNILRECDPAHLRHTRVHRLNNFGKNVFVKREDESGFGISGNKLRKYASLIPFLKKEKIQTALLIGGARSNHIPGILQLLTESQIDSKLFLKEAHNPTLHGNRLLSVLLSDSKETTWVTNQDWPDVEKIAETAAEKMSQKTLVIPEGGDCQASLAGACTLMLDIVENENSNKLNFQNIWIDAGTGFSAAALVLMNALLQRDCQIHVLLTAGDEASFYDVLTRQCGWLKESWDLETPQPKPLLYFSKTARSFGAVNATVIQEVLKMAREEGILVDPVYTAKLFLTARHYILETPPQGNTLVVHSGGGTGLMGFGESFEGK